MLGSLIKNHLLFNTGPGGCKNRTTCAIRPRYDASGLGHVIAHLEHTATSQQGLYQHLVFQTDHSNPTSLWFASCWTGRYHAYE